MISEITTLDEPATVAEIETTDEPETTAETTDEPATAEIETTDEPATAETTDEPATAEIETTDEPATAETTDEPATAEIETTDEPATFFGQPVQSFLNYATLMLEQDPQYPECSRLPAFPLFNSKPTLGCECCFCKALRANTA
jgi:hypothetical protein